MTFTSLSLAAIESVGALTVTFVRLYQPCIQKPPSRGRCLQELMPWWAHSQGPKESPEYHWAPRNLTVGIHLNFGQSCIAQSCLITRTNFHSDFFIFQDILEEICPSKIFSKLKTSLFLQWHTELAKRGKAQTKPQTTSHAGIFFLTKLLKIRKRDRLTSHEKHLGDGVDGEAWGRNPWSVKYPIHFGISQQFMLPMPPLYLGKHPDSPFPSNF